MSLENTLREMLSESEINPSPAPKQTPKSIQTSLIKSTQHAEENPNPTRTKRRPGVDYTPERKPGNPTRRGLKEFYKARLEGALLGETHEMSAREGARREGRLERIAGVILAGGVAAGGYGVGNLAVDSLMPSTRDVATHNAKVAAGEVLPPKGVSIKAVMDTAKPSPAYGAFQRGAIAAREAAEAAARAKGKKGK